MHSSVFLDAKGDVIRRALLWNDVRTTRQCEEITSKMGLSGLRRSVGNRALEGFTAPKLLWLRDNEPDSYSRLKTLLLAKDYVRYRLTGELATEPSDAAGTLLFDVRERRWSAETLSALGVPSEIMPRMVGSAEVSGVISGRVAGSLGLPADVPVVGGGADNAAAAVGSGVVASGRLQSSIGTSGTMLNPMERPRIDRGMRLHTFCHCIEELWYQMGTTLSAGESLRWLREVVTPGGGLDYDQLVAEAQDVEAGREGLFFLPYLAGERTPHNDADARGVFFGLSLAHSRANLARAVMEGVCFALRDSLELMRTTGVSFKDVRAVGGGSNSALWRRLQADVFGLPVVKMDPPGGPAYGAAILAGVGIGLTASVEEATERWVHVESVVEPDQRRADTYDELYQSYRRLYPALRARFAETAALTERLLGHG